MHSLRQIYPTTKPNHIPEWLNLTEAVHFNLQTSARKRINRKCLGRRVIVQKQRLRFVCWCFWNCRSRLLALLLGNFCGLHACTKVVVARDELTLLSTLSQGNLWILSDITVNRLFCDAENEFSLHIGWKFFELLGAPYIYVPSRKWRWRGRK